MTSPTDKPADSKLTLAHSGDPEAEQAAETEQAESRCAAVYGQHAPTSELQRARVTVFRYLNSRNVKLEVATGMWRIGDTSLTHAELGDRIWLRCSSLQVKMFAATLTELAQLERDEAVSKIRARLLSKASEDTVRKGRAELTTFVNMLAHESSTSDQRQYYELLLRQTIWQVKRKLRGLPTRLDMMVVFQGRQNTGKSNAVERFGKPLDFLYLVDANFSIFRDSFRIAALSNNYLVRFDECEQIGKADINAIKRLITAPIVQARAMRSQQERSLVRNASFLATTNLDFTEQLKDPTGMRRFGIIHCRDTDWTPEWGDKLNRIDWHALWSVESGLDDSAPTQQFAQLVQAYRPAYLPDYELWVDENCLPITGKKSSHKDVYARYAEHCRIQTVKPLDTRRFGKVMEKRFRVSRPGNNKLYDDCSLAAELPNE